MLWLREAGNRGLAFIATLAVSGAILAGTSVSAGADGGSGCDPFIGTCTVGVRLSGDGINHATTSSGERSTGPANPCFHNVTGRGCLLQYQCETVSIGWYTRSGLSSAANLSTAEVASLNVVLRARNCPPFGQVQAKAPLPVDVARQALATIRFPRPSGHRSPDETVMYDGLPFTYVHLWTYFWTARSTWMPLSATATVAGVSATVTATAYALRFDPGTGAAPVTCPDAGQPWTNADGNNPPPPGACGFRYDTVTSGGVTTTQSILWKIAWTGTGNSAGQFPLMVSSTTGRLQVLQIQVVTK